jgi:putative SOS response-associated peptidase YedK
MQMCGRMTLTTDDLAEVARQLDAQLDLSSGAEYHPRYNIAPTDPHWVVIPRGEGRVLTPARWGLRTARNPAVITVRSETAARRFRQAMAERRCLIPADGFYEWTGSAGQRRPIWFHAPDGRILTMAGFYELDKDGRPCFTILTTEPAPEIAPIHDRMPVVLPWEATSAWLALGPSELLVPTPPGFLVGTPANQRVNSVQHDDPSCLDPPDDKGQLDLL